MVVVLVRELVRVGVAHRGDGVVEGERRISRFACQRGGARVVRPRAGVQIPVVPQDGRRRDGGRRCVENRRPDVVANGRRPSGAVDAGIVRRLSLVAATLADVGLVDVRARGADMVIGGLLIQRSLHDQGALADRCRVLETQIAHDVERRCDVDAVRQRHVAAAQRHTRPVGRPREDVVPRRVVEGLARRRNDGDRRGENLSARLMRMTLRPRRDVLFASRHRPEALSLISLLDPDAASGASIL